MGETILTHKLSKEGGHEGELILIYLSALTMLFTASKSDFKPLRKRLWGTDTGEGGH